MSPASVAQAAPPVNPHVALTIATRKYGYGTTDAPTDPVLWMQKIGEVRHEFQAGRRPTFLQFSEWLNKRGYVPVDEATTGIKQIEVRHNMIVRRYSLVAQ